jgi:hypothetical protein
MPGLLKLLVRMVMMPRLFDHNSVSHLGLTTGSMHNR